MTWKFGLFTARVAGMDFDTFQYPLHPLYYKDQ